MPYSKRSRYEHEEERRVPRGYRVRTVKAGRHRVRVAYPPGTGRRNRGAGVVVSVLHPKGERRMKIHSGRHSGQAHHASQGCDEACRRGRRMHGHYRGERGDY